MIYTLTLNPALDIIISTDSISKNNINKTKLESVSAGGKGFNTSRALNCLKIDNTAVAFCGGQFSYNMKHLLEEEKIRFILAPIKDSIRVNIKVVENKSRKLIEFNEKGPLIGQKETGSLFSILKELKPKPEYMVISGSLPDGIDAGIYKKIIDILKISKVKTLLDTSGKALYHGMLALPYIVKINKNEINEVCEAYFRTKPERLIKYLVDKGIEIIMLTNGPRESLYFTKTEAYSITPSEVTGPYKTGAGDAVNAGLIYGLINNYSIEKKLKFAIACGDANISSEIPGLFEIKTVHKLMPSIKIKRI